MTWVLLVLAGLCEVAWAVALERSQSFTQPAWAVATLVALVASMVLLGLALRELPLGTAYAIWVGIGVLGTAAWGILVLGEPATGWRLAALALLVAGLVGVKLTTP